MIDHDSEVVPTIVAEGGLTLSISASNDNAASITLAFFGAELSPPIGIPCVEANSRNDILLVLGLTH